MMRNISNLRLWLKTALTIPEEPQAPDLQSWRHWFLNATATITVVFTLPYYLLFIFPFEWGHHRPLAWAELIFYALAFLNIVTRGRSFLGKPLFWLISIQILMVGYFYYWGPEFKPTAWLVMCGVLWAAYYGVWPSIVSVSVSIGAICMLHWVVKPSNPGWQAFYNNPQVDWGVYIAVVSWIALFPGIAVGFLLERMDRGLKSERHSKNRLKESELRFRALFDSDPNGIAVADMAGRIIDANRTLLKALNYSHEELVGRQLIDLAIEDRPEVLEQRFAALKSGIIGDTPYEVKYLGRTGQERHALARGWLITDENSTPVGIGVHYRDISQEKALKTENELLGRALQQAQKLEAIGTLAGGIAHDFNNLLSGIIGYTELAQMELADDESKAKTYLTRLLEAGQRARGLVQQILRFSRQEKSYKGPLSVSAVVKEVIKLLQSTLPSTIQIKAHVENGAMVITADATQIHQVVMNLCTNAYQAMRDNFGTLGITLEKVQLEHPKNALSMSIDAGSYVRITVSDTGEGIAPDHMEKIFDPYFTTKGTGEGTGLGLSVTMGIVKEHGGLIEAMSTPRGGSTFSVYLPFEQKTVTAPPEEKVQARAGENEQIMVVDDERFFLEIVSEHLSSLGYRVEAHMSSMAALGAFQQACGKFDLVISDQTMPEMTGLQLLAEFKKIRPDIPFILCTAYSDRTTEQDLQQHGIVSLLMKPVTRKELAEAVFHVLEAKGKTD